MTLSEAKDILITRIGWKADKTISSFVLSANNSQTDSGRYFQSEHPIVTLANIRNTQPVVDISDSDFNTYLEDLKEQVVLKVLSDAFERDYLDDDLLAQYPTSFDDLISLRMVIDVAELFMSTTRYNPSERIAEKALNKLHYDIYRESPNKFAVRGLNYKHSMGITTRYAWTLESVQRRFGSQRNLLKSSTRGQAALNNNHLNNYEYGSNNY